MPFPFWTSNKGKKENRRTKSFEEKNEQQHIPQGGQLLIRPEDLVVLQKLGNGRYGDVEQGEWNCGSGDKKVVTINSVPIEIQGEINKMLSLQHPHIVTLYGLSLPDPQLNIPLRLVTEYASSGSLLENLKQRNPEVCTVLSLHCYAVQIVSGMEYLSNKKFVHQNLAAHNILVFEPGKVKISYFGLARHLGNTDSLECAGMAISCCAPEVVRRREYSTAGDVWSYGMLLWEMFSFGDSPWGNLTDNEKAKAISEMPNQRLLCPKACPEEFYLIMLKCWQLQPDVRPTFTELHNRLDKIKLVQVKATTGCKADNLHHLSYKANDRITVVSSNRDDRNEWFGELQGVGSLGLFDVKNVKIIEDGASTRTSTEASLISRPYNLRKTEKSEILRQLNIDESSIPQLKRTPCRDDENSSPTSDPEYVDMDQGNASGKPFRPVAEGSPPNYVSMNIYEDADRQYAKRFQPGRQELGNDHYQAPLEVLRQIEPSNVGEIGEQLSNKSGGSALFPQRNAFDPMAESAEGENSSITEKKGAIDLLNVEKLTSKFVGGFSTIPRQKRKKTPPPVPERIDLLEEEEGRRRSQSESTLRRKESNMKTTDVETKSATVVRRRPVPTPRRRRVVSSPADTFSKPSTESEQGSTQSSVMRQQFPEDYKIPESQLAHELFHDCDKKPECELSLNGEKSNGSLNRSAKNVSLERLVEPRDDGQMLYYKLFECPDGEAEHQLSKLRLSPDGSETPDAGNSTSKLVPERTRLSEIDYESLKPTTVNYADKNLHQGDGTQIFAGDLADCELIDIHPPEVGVIKLAAQPLEPERGPPPALPPKDVISRQPLGSESYLPKPLLPSPPGHDPYLCGEQISPGSYSTQSSRIADAQGSPAIGRVWESFTTAFPFTSQAQVNTLLGSPTQSVISAMSSTYPPITRSGMTLQYVERDVTQSGTLPIPVTSGTQQYRGQILDAWVGARTPDTRPLLPVPGSPLTPADVDAQLESRQFGNATCSSSIPIQPIVTRPQIMGEARSNTPNTRPLPPIPGSESPLSPVLGFTLTPRYTSSVTSPTAPAIQPDEETLEQPIYDIPLPPVPLPPEIPMHILYQPRPDNLPFDTNTSYAHAHNETVVSSHFESNLTDINANVTSGKDSDTSVLSRDELERRYGRDAETVEQIHREFPYEYDTCHAWLLAYQGDQQAVLRYFKIHMLVEFTCKSEAKCKRALDLYDMNIQRAANHLITQGD